MAQEDDRGWLARQIEEALSSDGQQVRIDGFEGALSSRARMKALSISDEDGTWLRLTDVVLDWNRTALFGGTLSVNSLTAVEIDLDRLPRSQAEAPSPEATPFIFELPELPVTVDIGELRADTIRLGPSIIGEEIRARLQGGMRLAGGEGNARIALERIDGQQAMLALEGGFVNATRQLNIDMMLREAAGGLAATRMGLPGAPALDVTIKGQGPIDNFAADLALRSDQQNRLGGQVTLATTQDGGNRFGLDLKGDVTPLFLPDYAEFFGPDVLLQTGGTRSPDGALTLDGLRLRAAAIDVIGSAAIAADGLPEKLDLTLHMASPDGEPLLLPIPGDPVHLAKADLRLQFDAATGSAWNLGGAIEELATAELVAGRIGLAGDGHITRIEGRQQVDGTISLDSGGITLADDALAQAIGSSLTGLIGFDWQQGQSLDLSRLLLKGDDYMAQGTLNLTGKATDPQISAKLLANLTDLSRFSAIAGRRLSGSGDLGWSGTVNPLSGGFDGKLQLTGTDITLDQPEADGLLKGSSRILLDAARGADGTQIRDLEVGANALDVKGGGWIRSSGPDLDLNIAMKDLGVLGAGRSGNARVEAKLTGTSLEDDLRLVVTGEANDLRIGVPQADGFLRGRTTLQTRAHMIDGRFDIEQAELAGSGWRTTAGGSWSATLSDLKASFALDDLRQAGSGLAGALQGNLRYAMKAGREDFSLEADGRGLALGQPEADRLLRGNTRLTASGSRQDDVIRLEGLKLENPQLRLDAAAGIADNLRRLTLTGRLSDTALLIPGVPGPLDLRGTIVEQGSQMRLDINAKGPGSIDVTLAGTAAMDFSTTALTLRGGADAALANAFTGGAVAVRGPLRLDLAVNGAPGLNAVSGTVALSRARLSLTTPPFVFDDVSGNVTLGGGQATLAFDARSEAGGRLTLRGPVSLTAPFTGNLQARLEGLVLRDPQLYQTTANGEITINGPLTGGAMIAGNITMGETELRIPSSGLGGTYAIPELRQRAEPLGVRQTRQRAGLLDAANGRAADRAGPAFGLDVTVNAPGKVFIRGRGLDAELGGSFRITGSTANVQPSGGLQLIRGRLDLLGKRFDFTEGAMNMQGSLIPTIRLVATTNTVDGQASVIVDGPADQPAITFTSNPELPQEEVVARLLFGRGLTSLTPLQAAQLASAVASLTGKGGMGLVDNLRKSFGLDDFNLTTSASGAAELQAGKYIADNIYVDVRVDSGGRTEVSINLDLTKDVTVRARAAADGESGIGLHYERDY